jgi:hypothetical protein
LQKKYLIISKFLREHRRSDGTGVAPNQQANIRIQFSMERGMRIMNLVQVFFARKRIIPAVKRVESVSDRISYIILRGRWRDVLF